MNTVAVRDLVFAYGSLPVLAEISFDVGAGQILTVVGPSGCGKTTLLRCVAGLLKPSGGTVTIGGRSDDRQGLCAFVFQQPTLLTWLTVRENLQLQFQLQGKAAPNDVIEAELAGLGLLQFSGSFPPTLSVGMAQRAAFLRALIAGRGVLLLDEPFAALDELNRRELAWRLCRVVTQSGLAAIVVTHSVHDAVFLGNRLLVLSGRPTTVVADLTVDLPVPRDRRDWDGPELLPFIQQARSALEPAG
jgi:NitT/TauT family transport system ATP-binding protein